MVLITVITDLNVLQENCKDLMSNMREPIYCLNMCKIIEIVKIIQD